MTATFDDLLRVAMTSRTLPPDLDDVLPDDRERLDAFARRRGIAPVAALSLIRKARRDAMTEGEALDSVIAEIRRRARGVIRDDPSVEAAVATILDRRRRALHG
jgi:hypothetical protein